MSETFYGKNGWNKQKVSITDKELLVGKTQVMQAWESSLMIRMVQEVMKGVYKPAILEVGWGMGFSGNKFLEESEDYHIIEPHPDIIKTIPESAVIHEGFWQDFSGKFNSQFDIIFYDAYPLVEEDAGVDFIPFFEDAYKWLKPGGRFTFFSDQHDGFDNDILCKLLDLFDSVELYKIGDLKPYSHTTYWNYDHMIIPICYKDMS